MADIEHYERQAKRWRRKQHLAALRAELYEAMVRAQDWKMSYEEINEALKAENVRANQAEQDKRQLLVELREIIAGEGKEAQDTGGDHGMLMNYWATGVRALYEKFNRA